MKDNKYQEALDRIKVHVPDYELINNSIVEVDKQSDLSKLQELIDKETPMKTIDEINKQLIELRDAGVSRKEVSDGYHTFDELYYHRMILFSIICNQNKEIAWKSKLHDDGTMFDDNFIVGVTTAGGQYTYHYHLDYWDMYDVRELEYAPKYDGHMPEDITRLLSIWKSTMDIK